MNPCAITLSRASKDAVLDVKIPISVISHFSTAWPGLSSIVSGIDEKFHFLPRVGNHSSIPIH